MQDWWDTALVMAAAAVAFFVLYALYDSGVLAVGTFDGLVLY